MSVHHHCGVDVDHTRFFLIFRNEYSRRVNYNVKYKYIFSKRNNNLKEVICLLMFHISVRHASKQTFQIILKQSFIPLQGYGNERRRLTVTYPNPKDVVNDDMQPLT